MFQDININKIYIQRNCQTIQDGTAGKRFIDNFPHVDEFRNLHIKGYHSQKYIDFLKNTIKTYKNGDIIEKQLSNNWTSEGEGYIKRYLDNCKYLYQLIKKNREIYPISLVKVDSNYYYTHQGHHRIALAYILGYKTIKSFVYDICEDTSVPLLDNMLEDLKQVEGIKGKELTYLPINSLQIGKWKLLRKSSFCKLRNIFKYIVSNYSKSLKILEVGSNTGYFSRMLIKLGFVSIISLERLKSMWNIAKYLSEYHSVDTLFKPYRYSLQYFNTTIEDFEDNSFCIILFTDIIHHIIGNNRVKVMKKLSRMLKDNGSIIVTKGNLKDKEWNDILVKSNLEQKEVIYKDNDFGYGREIIILKKS